MRSGLIVAALLLLALPAAAALPTFTIDAQRGPATGYRLVHLHALGFAFEKNASVLFDTTPAPGGVTITSFSDASVLAPPHAPGTVEVFVVQNGIAYHSPNQFTFVGPNEELLVPIAVDGAPGAYGTRWTSEIWVHNDADQAVRVTPEFCFNLVYVDACSQTVSVPAHATTALALRSGYPPNPFILLHPPADQVDKLHFSVRLHEANSDPEGAGTEIPVIRTRDFQKEVVLPAIPTSDRFRGVLRIYTYDLNIVVNVFDAMTGELLDARPIARVYMPDGGQFGTVTIHDLLTTPLVHAHDRVTITIEAPFMGAWALMTLTDDATQHVSTYTPQ